MARRAADLEQRARAVEVHAHAEIEVRFRLAADHRREMKNGGGSGRRRRARAAARSLMSPVTCAMRESSQPFSRDDVDERDPVDRFVPAAGGEMTALQQPGCQGLAEEAGTAGNEDAHGR